MKLPTLLRSKHASDSKETAPSPTTLSSSQNTSKTEIEKQAPIAPSSTLSTKKEFAEDQNEKNIIETTPIKEAEALDKLSDEPEYPTGAKLAIITASLCLSVFLMALDNTIIATAIPKITDHFKALDDVGWYGSCMTNAEFSCIKALANCPSSLSAHYLCLSTVLRKAIHVLQHKMGILGCNICIRGRLRHLWCCTKLCGFDHWPSRRRGRFCRYYYPLRPSPLTLPLLILSDYLLQ